MLVIAFIAPWLSYGQHFINSSDIFLIIYLFGLARFFTVLAALDAGSVFGGFGASREVTLALLVEPGVILCFASLGCVGHTSSLAQIFSYSVSQNQVLYEEPALWLLAGTVLFLASLVELSRMPVDDPNTHLELTMVHEAMILENSGPNLALTEYTHYLKMCILLGLSGQCFLHAVLSACRASRVECQRSGAGHCQPGDHYLSGACNCLHGEHPGQVAVAQVARVHRLFRGYESSVYAYRHRTEVKLWS